MNEHQKQWIIESSAAAGDMIEKLLAERTKIIEALGISYDEEDKTYWVLGKFVAYECETLVEAAGLARTAPEKAWYNHVRKNP